MGRRSKPVRAGGVLKRLIGRAGLDKDLKYHRLRDAWAELVGERVAKNAAPIKRSRQGKLTVAVRSAAWLNELNFLRETMLEQIAKRFGAGYVRELQLIQGDVPEYVPPSEVIEARQRAAPTDRQRELAEARAAHEVPTLGESELTEAARRARAAQLLRDADDPASDG